MILGFVPDAVILTLLIWMVSFAVVSLCTTRRLKATSSPVTKIPWPIAALSSLFTSLLAGFFGFIVGGTVAGIGMIWDWFGRGTAGLIFYSAIGLLVLLVNIIVTRIVYREHSSRL